MYDPFPMKVFQPIYDLCGYVADDVEVETADPFDVGEKLAAAGVFHDVEKLVRGLEGFDEADDVRVVALL